MTLTVGESANLATYAVGAVEQTDFAIPFPFDDADDLRVYVDDVPVPVLELAAAEEGGLSPAGGTVRIGAVSNCLVVVAREGAMQQEALHPVAGRFSVSTLNRETSRFWMGLQDLRGMLRRALRVPRSEGPLSELPYRAARRNKVLGFDAAGDVLLTNPADLPGVTVTPDGGSVPMTLAQLTGREVDPRAFGAVFDGVTDDTLAIQAAANWAAFKSRPLLLCHYQARITAPVTVAGSVPVIRATGVILSAVPGAQPALVLGDATTSAQHRDWRGIRVKRVTQSDWTDNSIGVLVRNLDASELEIQLAEGFNIGIRLVGTGGRGFEDTTVHYGRIVNNQYGVDLWCDGAGDWNNSVRHIGGHFANASSVNPAKPRYGVRLAHAPGAYPRHNAHAFYGPAFELQRQGTPGTVEAIPFLILATDARAITGRDIRMEGCSPYVCRVDGQASDCLFDVAYVGTYAWKGTGVLYASATTRNGVTVQARHSAIAAIGTPRLFADAGSVRARAYRDSTISANGQGMLGAIGFDELAVLSSNPSNPALTMAGLLFPGLTFVNAGDTLLTGDTVGMHSGRAIGFVVNVSRCKEIMVAAEGELLRLVAMQFDTAGTLLQQSYPVTLSQANILWNPGRDAEQHVVEGIGTAYWWEMNVNLDEPLVINVAGNPVETVQDVNRMQRIRFHDAASYAFLGVRGGEIGAQLRSLRLYCDTLNSPPILYGGGRAWGQRERTLLFAADPASIAAGARISQAVTFPQARQGDQFSAGFAQDSGFQSAMGNLRFSAACAGPGNVTVWIENLGASAVDLTAGSFYVTCTKPRI